MSRKYTGAARKRTNTPADNRKRAVEYRHRPFAHASVLQQAAVNTVPDETEISASEIIEPAVSETETAAEQIGEEIAAEKVSEAVQSVQEAADVLPAAAAGGFFGRIAGAFKGLFGGRKKDETASSQGIVSDLKTWMNSPIDPDGDNESAEEIADEEISVPEETASANENLTEEVSDTAEETAESISAEEPAQSEEAEELSEEYAETAEEEPVPAETAEEPAEETSETEVTEESAEASEEEPALTEAEESAEGTSEKEVPEVTEEESEEEPASAETAEEPAEETSETEVTEEASEEEPVLTEAAEESAEETSETEVTEESEETSDEEPALTETAEEPVEDISETEVTEEAEETSEEEPVLTEIAEEPAEETSETEVTEESEETSDEEPALTEAAEEPAEETGETEVPEEAAETSEEEPVLTEAAEEPAEEASENEETEEVFEEEPVPEEPAEPELTKEEKAELKKQISRETKEQLIDEIIDRPKAGLLLMAVAPGLAMKNVSSVEKTTLSAPSVLILNLIKWGAIGTFFAIFIEKFINLFNYSFIRMNFTATAGLAFRFGIIGLILEYVCYIVIGLVCGLMRKKISTLKLMDVQSRSALAVGLLFIIACVFVQMDKMALGVALASAGAIIGWIMKGYGMDLTLPVSKTTQLIMVAVLVAGAVLCGFKYFPMTVSGLMDIFRTILNI